MRSKQIADLLKQAEGKGQCQPCPHRISCIVIGGVRKHVLHITPDLFDLYMPITGKLREKETKELAQLVQEMQQEQARLQIFISICHTFVHRQDYRRRMLSYGAPKR